MDVFVGLDASLASTSICVLDEKGKIVTEARVASAPEALVGFLRKLPHRIATVGLEAGALSHWLYKGMTDAGFEAVLMETRQVKGALYRTSSYPCHMVPDTAPWCGVAHTRRVMRAAHKAARQGVGIGARTAGPERAPGA